MKIAIHNAQISYHTGGTERLIYEQVKNLLKFPELKISVITTKTQKPSNMYLELKKIKNKKLKIFEFELKQIVTNNYSSNNPNKWHTESINFGFNTKDFYKNNKFDLVITHFSTDSMFIPLNQKNVLHLHGVTKERSDIGEMSLCRPDAFISVSKYVKSRWISLYPEIQKKKIFVVYPGIDTNKFFRSKKEKTIDVLFVGRLIKIKGVDFLIEALKKLKKVRAVIVGDGPEKEKLLKKINLAGLSNRVEIFSNVSDAELFEIYNSAKMLVAPSFAKEGMVLTTLEASSCGCPVIASNSCSFPEFFENGKNGLLFEPMNSNDLAKKIKMLLSRPDLRKKFSEAAMKKINTDWKSEQRVEELFNTYKEISRERPK